MNNKLKLGWLIDSQKNFIKLYKTFLNYYNISVIIDSRGDMVEVL